jgi:hypothetical protein
VRCPILRTLLPRLRAANSGISHEHGDPCRRRNDTHVERGYGVIQAGEWTVVPIHLERGQYALSPRPGDTIKGTLFVRSRSLR